MRNVSVLIADGQRNKSYSNRYSHRNAATCYQTFREEYCGGDEYVVLGGNTMRQSAKAKNLKMGVDDDLYSTNSDKAITITTMEKCEVRILKIEFDIKRCSPMLVKFVHNKTGGIPAMYQALVRDHNLVFVKNGGNLDCSSIERLGDLALGLKKQILISQFQRLYNIFLKMLDSLNDYNNSQLY